MTLFALWYHHSTEGLRFLESREIRVMMAAAGILAAYILIRTRRRFFHQESRWWTVGRLITAGSIATAVWLGVDWARSEDWVFQLLTSLPDLSENGIRYLVLITAGWLGLTIAIFEGMRWLTIVRHRGQAEPVGPGAGEGTAGSPGL